MMHFSIGDDFPQRLNGYINDEKNMYVMFFYPDEISMYVIHQVHTCIPIFKVMILPISTVATSSIFN